MEKYVCSVCGYVYDPAVGDPDKLNKKNNRNNTQGGRYVL